MKKQYLISILGLAALSISFGNGFSIMTSSSNGTTSMEPTSSTSFSKEELSTIEEYENEFPNYSIEQISAGSSHSAAVVNDGSGADGDHLYTWGLNDNDQLGLGDNARWSENIPQEVTELPSGDIEQISMGEDHSAAIVNIEGTDELYTWGANDKGQLGLGTGGEVGDHESIPQEVTFNEMPDGNIEQISMGGDHSAAIVNGGSDANGDCLYTWGYNNNGQLGLGDDSLSFYNTPQNVESLSDGDIEQISMGYAYSAMVINDGTNDNLYTWGNNNSGQLGLGNKNSIYFAPVEVDKDNEIWSAKAEIEQISMGEFHSAAIVDGVLYTWGSNSKGQLGLGDNEDYNTPQEVTFFNGKENIEQISTGSYHSAAVINNNGTDELYTWGANDKGQLGLGDNEDCNTPQEVTKDLPDVEIKQISMGGSHSVAIVEGELYTWGRNDEGQLGLGNNENYDTPRLVPTFFPYLTEIESKVIKSDGSKEITINYSFETNLDVKSVDVNILPFNEDIEITEPTLDENSDTNVWEGSQNIIMTEYGKYSYSLDLTYLDGEGTQTIENIDEGDFTLWATETTIDQPELTYEPVVISETNGQHEASVHYELTSGKTDQYGNTLGSLKEVSWVNRVPGEETDEILATSLDGQLSGALTCYTFSPKTTYSNTYLIAIYENDWKLETNVDAFTTKFKNPWLRPWGIVGISIVAILLIVIIFGALFYLINKYKKNIVK